ncbi:MAG: invasion associated locus B family protein [Alphaproteobacteria bacterium]|nr:invasion associated locus B family protein [Alphaproteobacteria bacterium]
MTFGTVLRMAALAVALMAAGPAFAQAQTGGNTYVKETHGAWEIRCLERQDGPDPCQMFQRLNDANGTPTAEVNLFSIAPGQAAAAGMVVVTPLETLLQAQLGLQIDSAGAKRYPFAWCTEAGCIVRIALTPAELEAMKKGNRASVTIVPAAAPNSSVVLNASLSGFTAAFNAMQAANAAPAQ